MSGPGKEIFRRRSGLTLDAINDSRPRLKISVDAMGGDSEPAELVAGVALAAERLPHARFCLFGDEQALRRAAEAVGLAPDRFEISHAPHAVSMDDKPSDVIRRAGGTSMAAAIASVETRKSDVVVSCGNTGALMALASLRLGRIDGVARPAIAALWPSVAEGKSSIVLDVGADIRIDAHNLCQFAVMGAACARPVLDLGRPRVGLLNIGSEAHKGNRVLHEASELIERAASRHRFDYRGFIEANDIPMDVVDVAVTDGFTGNIALKAAEGTARLIGLRMKSAFTASPFAQIGAALASGAFSQLKRSLDPRQVNGGVLLGLRGAVVKSHGDSDALGFASALMLASRVGGARLPQTIAETIGRTSAEPGEGRAPNRQASPPANRGQVG